MDGPSSHPRPEAAIQTQPTEAVPAGPGPDALATTTPAVPGQRSALAIVFLVVFIDLLGFGIVLPLLPLYGESYVSALFEGGHERGAGGAVLGLLMASFSAMQFIFAPVWGRISDRVGRRPILLVGLAGSVVFYTLFGYASDLPLAHAALALALLFVARLGAGISGATIATAQAVIADCTPPERRKHGMALIGAAFGIGFTFGPLVGFAALTWFPEHRGAIGYAAATLSLIALVLGVILLPETRRFELAPPLDRKWFNWHGVRVALRTPAIAPVVLVFFLSTLGFGSFEVTLSLLNKDALHLSNTNNFLVFAYVGFVLMLTQGFLYRRLAKRLSEATFISVGLVLMALGVASLGAVSWLALQGTVGPAKGAAAGTAAKLVSGGHDHDFDLLLGLLLASLTLAVVGFAFLTPSAQALISRRTDPGKQGEVLGVNQSAAALARILGPIFGLTLYGLTATHLLPYAFGAALLLLMLPLLPRLRRG